MNGTSPVKTGAIGSVTAAVVTIIAALVKHYNIDIPADAQVSIAVGIVSAAHWFGQRYAAKNVKSTITISTPAAVPAPQPAAAAQQ